MLKSSVILSLLFAGSIAVPAISCASPVGTIGHPPGAVKAMTVDDTTSSGSTNATPDSGSATPDSSSAAPASGGTDDNNALPSSSGDSDSMSSDDASGASSGTDSSDSSE